MSKQRVLIMGAAGRDFHNFNMVFRGNEAYEVVAFTATQIPNIEGRRYPSELAGALYPSGIPIYPESEMPTLVRMLGVDQVLGRHRAIASWSWGTSSAARGVVRTASIRPRAAGAGQRWQSPRWG